MRSPKARHLLVCLAVAAPFIAGCGIVEPGDTYDIPRAVTRPVKVSGDLRFADISSGYFHSCAIDNAGRAWCWGDNLYKQAGQSDAGVPCDDGLSRCIVRPSPVETSLTFATISAGVTHTCALTLEGLAYCWGGGYVNQRGILGDGQMTLSAKPVAVAGGLRFKSISAGGRVTCAVATDDKGYCWGLGGTVGDGTRNDALSPVPVAGNLSFTSVAAGGLHACGITTAGVMWCWGSNQQGQIGDGRVTGLAMGAGSGPTAPVKVNTEKVFEAVAAGGNHTCGVTRDGDVLCWGNNHVGQLGIGSPSAPQATPQTVVGGRGLRGLAANAVVTCALKPDGVAMCWGGNWFGAIGDGTSTAQNTGTERPVPTPSSTSVRFSHIAPGGSHTCALAMDGRAWCWGDRGRGQMGDGKT